MALLAECRTFGGSDYKHYTPNGVQD